MSLAPKIDKIRESVRYANYDFVCITETWLKDHIDNNVVSISGYNVVRRDCYNAEHGGVYKYLSKIPSSSKFLKTLKTINLKFFGLNCALPGSQEVSPVLLLAHYIIHQVQPTQICLTTFTIVYQ